MNTSERVGRQTASSSPTPHGQVGGVNQGACFYLSRKSPAPSQLAGRECQENYSTWPAERQPGTRPRRRVGQREQVTPQLHASAPNYAAGQDALDGLQSGSNEGTRSENSTTQLAMTDYAAESCADPRVPRRTASSSPAPGRIGISFLTIMPTSGVASRHAVPLQLRSGHPAGRGDAALAWVQHLAVVQGHR